MSAWFARISAGCNALAADFGPPWVIVCAALATTVLALIALGFRSWRAQLAPGGQIVRGHARRRDGGLVELWRLYRAVPTPPRGDRAANGSAHDLVAAHR